MNSSKSLRQSSSATYITLIYCKGWKNHDFFLKESKYRIFLFELDFLNQIF